MAHQGNRLASIFGLDKSRNPASYVVRDVEVQFLEALEDSAINAIVIYGMSKQGKSSLLRHALNGRDHVMTDGNRGVSLESLFHELLLKAKFTYEEREIEGKVTLNWFFGEAGIGGGSRRIPLPIKISNPSSVARALADHLNRPVIVVDQFHTLDPAVQREFATAVATFAAEGSKVIIIGTWTDSGYLIKYNNNLIGTIREYSFDEWSSVDLHAVLNTGLPLLGLDKISKPVRQSLVDRSEGNVALLQEMTKLCLLPFERDGDISKAVALTKDDVESVAKSLLGRVYNDVLQALKRISQIGGKNPFVAEKSRSWWVLNAFLNQESRKVMEGVAVDSLVRESNSLTSSSDSKMSKAEIVGLLKQHWYAEQTKDGATPILSYHDVKDALVIVDAWTKFTLRTYPTRQKLKAEL